MCLEALFTWLVNRLQALEYFIRFDFVCFVYFVVNLTAESRINGRLSSQARAPCGPIREKIFASHSKSIV
jgi:hypothetical protein